jgi:cytochrome c553
MKGFAANLSEKDMRELAAFFSSQSGLVAPEINNP